VGPTQMQELHPVLHARLANSVLIQPILSAVYQENTHLVEPTVVLLVLQVSG